VADHWSLPHGEAGVRWTRRTGAADRSSLRRAAADDCSIRRIGAGDRSSLHPAEAGDRWHLRAWDVLGAHQNWQSGRRRYLLHSVERVERVEPIHRAAADARSWRMVGGRAA
jgi:hypothetical protein